jgi:hypothetical protein
VVEADSGRLIAESRERSTAQVHLLRADAVGLRYDQELQRRYRRIGHIMDKIRFLGLDKNTLVFFTTYNGAWQDVYPDAGYTPFRGTKGTEREVITQNWAGLGYLRLSPPPRGRRDS